MNPKKIDVRESRDSVDSPNATPVVLCADVTGSMGSVIHDLLQNGLGKLVKEILERKPVSNPHIMGMAVGDAYFDSAPLQVTQFEADIRVAQQMKDFFIEGGGGGNSFESYNLPWYFAAMKTDIDSVTKRGQKGILFTFGDEECPPVLTKEHIKKVFGDDVPNDIPTADLLALVQQKYDVFHVVVTKGSHMRYEEQAENVYKSWNSVLPQGHVIRLTDITKTAEVITSVMEVHAGKSPDAVARSWDRSTAMVVREATKDMQDKSLQTTGDSGVWRPGKAAGGRGM